jgi:hypothetical protein
MATSRGGSHHRGQIKDPEPRHLPPVRRPASLAHLNDGDTAMAKATADHDEIREWAESKGGKPAAVERTHQGGDVGIVRIMFPDSPQSEHQSLVEISWDEFFQQFEESNLALLYEEDSLFSKIVGRDTLERREHGEHASRHHSRGSPSAGRQEAGSSSKSEDRGGAEKASAGKQDAGAKKESATSKHSGERDSDDLKSREYRDKEGNIHHHTKTYSEQHGGKK